MADAAIPSHMLAHIEGDLERLLFGIYNTRFQLAHPAGDVIAALHEKARVGGVASFTPIELMWFGEVLADRRVAVLRDALSQ